MTRLDEAVKALQKKFGKSYIVSGTEILDVNYKRNSLGIFPLDVAIGGGIPERKMIMLAGKEGAGKTATALTAIAACQKAGGKVALLNVEHGFDEKWAIKMGVDYGSLLIAQPATIEEISDTIEPLILTGELDLIVLDSIASASSDKELEESAEKGVRSGNAKANGAMVRKITSRLNDPSSPVKTSIILVNQIREKQNIMFGNPEYTPGGHSLHHHCDIIVWLRPDSKPLGDKENPTGITINFRCTKNRTAPPFRVGTYDLLFEGRIDNSKSIIEMGIVTGVINKVGYKYTYKDVSVTDIKPFTKALTPEHYEDIKKEILEQANKGTPVVADDLEIEVGPDPFKE